MDETPLRISSFVDHGVTYTALAPLLQAMGGWETHWDSAASAARSQTELYELTAPIGAMHLTVNGHFYELNAPVLARNGRTYVPLRSTANLLGGSVTFAGWHTPITVVTGNDRAYSDEDLYWLSRIISAESRGEGLLGQLAVGNVVLNRVDALQFPGSVREVVFDRKHAVQFEPVANGSIHWEPTTKSELAARMVLSGATVVEDCLYFFAPALSQGSWIRENRTYFTTIGCHRFYR